MYIVSYDISSDRLRNKVAKEMEGFGIRVQYSVFECELNEHKFKLMYKKLLSLTQDMETGNIRIYHICGKCEKRITIIGVQVQKYEQSKDQVIIV